MASVDVLFNNERIKNQPLEKDEYTIGRQDGCDIRIDNLGISRNHARIVRDGSGFVVEDLQSSNGTFVNGVQVQKHNLNEGDEIAIGKYLIIFRASSEVPASNADVDTTDESVSEAVSSGGDALNTMAMDGDAIRKRLEAMQKEKAAAQAAAPARETEKAGGASTPQPAAAPASNTPAQKSNTTAIIIGVVVTLAVIGSVVAYLVLGGGN